MINVNTQRVHFMMGCPGKETGHDVEESEWQNIEHNIVT